MPAHKRFANMVRISVYMDRTDREGITKVADELRLSVSQLMLLSTLQVVDDEVAWREAGRRRTQILRSSQPLNGTDDTPGP